MTVEQLLTGDNIDRRPMQTSVTFKKAPEAVAKGPEKKKLDFDELDDTDQPF